MALPIEQLKKIFIPAGHIHETDFVHAADCALRDNTSVEFQLVHLGIISDYNLGKTIADALEYDFCDLSAIAVDAHFLEYIPEIVARAQMSFVFSESDTCLNVATLFPNNIDFQMLLEKKVGKKVCFYYVAPVAMAKALNQYKGDYQKRITALLEKGVGNTTEGVVVELVNILLEYGYESKASDIHLEPLEKSIRIRFRIDGVLHEVANYSKLIHDQVAFRIKILSQLQTDEHGRTQDGRFSYSQLRDTFDIRVSIIPVTDGENIVMRLLSSNARQYTIESLNFSPADLKKVLHALSQPHGMILAVGPTGSGKTTVLYAMLEHLNTPEINIMTIEDPVEYDVQSVQQTQVNASKDLVFSTGLRSIVRQDPDVIMVGEIRDEETADIAVNAAMTGHLLLSTLHTNDAATTFPRLSEMGVEPFLVASSVRIIVSLRLVRAVCTHCKESYFLSEEDQQLVKNETVVSAYIAEITGNKKLETIRFYRGAGCKVCRGTGFSGRSAIFEVLEVDSNIRVLISKKVTSAEIHQAAITAGMKPLLFDGISKALSGQTTIMEVIKTTRT